MSAAAAVRPPPPAVRRQLAVSQSRAAWLKRRPPRVPPVVTPRTPAPAGGLCCMLQLCLGGTPGDQLLSNIMHGVGAVAGSGGGAAALR